MKTSLLLAVSAWACLVSGLQAQQTLRIRGSDTLGAKLMPQLAEQFKLSHGRELSFDIAAEGSSTAFTNLASDTADIGMSSRRIKAEESRLCESKGIVLREMEIAWDLIVIVVNEENPVTNLTRQQVRQIFTGEIRDWSELGGKPGRVSAYTRNTSSGAYKDFMSLALGNQEYGTRTQKMAGNEQIAAEVGANVNGVGYVGYAYADAKSVRIVSIDGVLPVPAMVKSYAFSRPTYLYTRGEPAGMVKAFMDYINTPTGDVIVSSCGFVPKSQVR